MSFILPDFHNFSLNFSHFLFIGYFYLNHLSVSFHELLVSPVRICVGSSFKCYFDHFSFIFPFLEILRSPSWQSLIDISQINPIKISSFVLLAVRYKFGQYLTELFTLIHCNSFTTCINSVLQFKQIKHNSNRFNWSRKQINIWSKILYVSVKRGA